MNSFSEQYRAGQRSEVWASLRKLGEYVWDNSILPSARSVAAIAVERCIENISMLHSRLIKLGYQFLHPEAAFALARAGQEGHLNEFEHRYGRLPLFVRVWHEKIESVDFSQTPSQLRPP